MIHLDQVNKTYQTSDGPVQALLDVSLRVEKGEFVAVRGPSGCGKSTLLTIVGGLGSP
ncbi:MAG: ATP-binding cassette domain-containing protein, partial [Planctomycetota bacterium]